MSAQHRPGAVIRIEGTDFAVLQSWAATNHLRWAMSQADDGPAWLEQLWQGSHGDVEWRRVETVVLPIPGLSQAPR